MPSRALVTSLFVLTLMTISSLAQADARVVVRTFSGPGSSLVQEEVVSALEKQSGVEVIDSGAADRTARRRGVDLNGAIGKKEVAREMEISAWIEGRVVKRAGKLHASIVLIDARSNSEVGTMTLVRKKPKQLQQAARAQAARQIARKAGDTEAPESAYEKEEESSDDSEGQLAARPASTSRDSEMVPGLRASDDSAVHVDGETQEPRKRAAVSAFEADVGMLVMHRALRFSDAVSPGVADYSLGAAPVADVAMRIYPGAFFRDGLAAYVGLDLNAQLGLGLRSENAEGTQFATKYSAYSAGLIGRYPIEEHEIHAVVGYGGQRFSVANAAGEAPPVPNVNYRAARFGAGGRYQVAPSFTVGLDATWLMMTSFGELASKEWFPNTTGSGVAGELFADLRVWGAVNARASVTYQREFFSFNSKPGDAHVAGGAVDDYLYGGLALAYAY